MKKKIVELVCTYYGTTLEEILTTRRAGPYESSGHFHKQVLSYLLSIYSNATQREIAELLQLNDRSAISRHIKKIHKQRTVVPSLRTDLEYLDKQIQSLSNAKAA